MLWEVLTINCREEGKNFLSETLRTQSREALALNIRVTFSVSCLRLLLLLEENFPRFKSKNSWYTLQQASALMNRSKNSEFEHVECVSLSTLNRARVSDVQRASFFATICFFFFFQICVAFDRFDEPSISFPILKFAFYLKIDLKNNKGRWARNAVNTEKKSLVIIIKLY